MPSNKRPASASRTDTDLPNSGPIEYMHDVFAEPHRRHVLHCLDETAGPVALSTLADDLHRDRDQNASPSAIERWLLYEHVLPLDRFGLVTYDPSNETVELSEEVVVTVTAPRSAELNPAVDPAEEG